MVEKEFVMAEKEDCCSSCKKRLSNTGVTRFLCPSCSKQEIIRCKHCREAAIRYRCPECGFQGPN